MAKEQRLRLRPLNMGLAVVMEEGDSRGGQIRKGLCAQRQELSFLLSSGNCSGFSGSCFFHLPLLSWLAQALAQPQPQAGQWG